jgi:hypothetical protein
MRIARPRLLPAALAAGTAIALAGCGRSHQLSGPSTRIAPVAPQGAVAVTTRNTSRLGGTDAVADAAAVARTVYPGLTQATSPAAVVVVDRANWSGALAASELAGAPLAAPLLYAEGGKLGALSAQTLAAMHPRGAGELAGAQVIRVATSAPVPGGLQTRTLAAGEPAVQAAAIEAILQRAQGGRAPRAVIVLAANAARSLQMPAAGLAAESGAPILFVNFQRVPVATASVLTALHRPSIYVIGAAAIGARTLRTLRRFGAVTRITTGAASAEGAVSDAIAVARFTDGVFGWGVREPGHGLVFENAARALDAPAAALLSATGDYGPVLLQARPAPVSSALASYLANIQPAYTAAPQFRPVRGVYNHGWLIGDERAISALTQAEVDALLEISPRRASSEEPSLSPPE